VRPGVLGFGVGRLSYEQNECRVASKIFLAGPAAWKASRIAISFRGGRLAAS
jgi:hypothetical protein